MSERVLIGEQATAEVDRLLGGKREAEVNLQLADELLNHFVRGLALGLGYDPAEVRGIENGELIVGDEPPE